MHDVQGTPWTAAERTTRLLVEPPAHRRDYHTTQHAADLVVVGGGLSGTCAAITAARAGLEVVLIQDRPVLGGNSSSEVRLWVLGATAHQGNNNRFAREGGVVDEILVENTYRNPDGNPLIYDTILLEKVAEEPGITLLLNTALVDVSMTDEVAERSIAGVVGFCSQNSTRYEVTAPYYIDASGDGALSFLAGAGFRMGAEPASEFDEPFAPSAEYGDLLGHSIYFYTKDVGHPVKFVPPSFALADLSEIPRARSFNANEDGCRLWWIEWGGRYDTVHETEMIKWRLWQVVYGVWDHIKNSGEFPESENLTLEWVGTIPGKRESRRFEGLYMLRQSDLLDQVQHDDAVAFGGWSIDLHPADGVFSERPGCDQLHGRGTYQIPYRSLVSRDVDNLFFAGRLTSVSHVAFGSTRVMATGSHCGQAVATAAALCVRDGLRPAQLLEPDRMAELQRWLLRGSQHIPQHVLDDPDDLARTATVSASSELRLGDLPAGEGMVRLDIDRGQLLPLGPRRVPQVHLTVDVEAATTLHAQLRRGSRPDDYTPDVLVAEQRVDLVPGRQLVKLDFDGTLQQPSYAVLCLLANPHIAVQTTDLVVTGLMALRHVRDQKADDDIGQPGLAFWTPVRRPEGKNLALTLDPPLAVGSAEYVTNGLDRPTAATNAWIADPDDPAPTLRLGWDERQTIGRIELRFDTDFDHAMESVLRTHPEDAMPQCVSAFTVRADGQVVARVTDHHQSAYRIVLEQAIHARELTVSVDGVSGNAPASLFSVRCYAEPDHRMVQRTGR